MGTFNGHEMNIRLTDMAAAKDVAQYAGKREYLPGTARAFRYGDFEPALKATIGGLRMAENAGETLVVSFAVLMQITVTAMAETTGTGGDADDPAIWVNPDDPAQSLILGTDKQEGVVFGLDGAETAFLPDGKLNNVDIRPFILNGQRVALAGASKRDDDIYGFAMGQDASGTYALVNFKSGHVLQYRIEDAAGQLQLPLARHWQVGSQPEGMVADDTAGHVVGEKDVGIWRYALDPGLPATPFALDMIPSACLPQDDVDGLAIHEGPKGRYLVASAQGIHRAAVYQLEGDAQPPCVALVGVGAGAIDGATETDGLAVTAMALPGYPEGMLVMMDDQNEGYTTEFRIIDWRGIAASLP